MWHNSIRSVRTMGLLSLLFCLGQLRCAADGGSVVGVTVTGVPAGASLKVDPRLNGQDQGARVYQGDLYGNGPQLGLSLSSGAQGYLHVDASAADDKGCVLGRGSGGLVVAEPARYDLTIALVLLATPECPPTPPPPAPLYSLVVTPAGEGSGTVTSQPTGISCPGTCTARFADGTKVLLVAHAATDSRFHGWSGGCAQDPCQVTVGQQGAQVSAGFHRKVCSQDGFCWENPLPQGNDLYSVWGSSGSDVWAVGNAGTLLHWDGRAWSGRSSPATNSLVTVWGSGPNDVWFGNSASDIVHWDGKSLTKEPVGLANAFWGSGPGDVWSFADTQIGHYEGGAFRTKFTASASLNAAWGSGSKDIWAVGQGGLIVRWDGTAWAEITPKKTTHNLYALWGSGPGDVYAAGEAGTVLHFDGSGWTQMADVNIPQIIFRGVWGSGPGDVWFSGENASLTHYSGGVWSTLPVPTKLQSHRSIWGSGKGDIWSVGLAGEMIHYDGLDWSACDDSTCSATIQNPRAALKGIWGSGPGDIWAAGGDANGQAVVLHGDGAAWKASPVDGLALQTVWGSGPTDVYVGGNSSTCAHFDGHAWSSVTTGAGNDISFLWGTGAGDVWAATASNGASKPVLSRSNGATWVNVPTVAPNINGLWGSGPKDVWAVHGYAQQNAPMIEHWDGLTWTTALSSSATGFSATALWGSGPNDVWAVGGLAGMYHYDGTKWSDVIPTKADYLYAIWGSGPADIWAVGAHGTIVHLDGQLKAPTQIASPTAYSLTGVWGSSRDDVWISGQLGTLLHRQNAIAP